jgi:L,D-transpeptidase YcbB
MTTPFTRRNLLLAGTGIAAGMLVRKARADQQTSDQALNELIQENQDTSVGSGFDDSLRGVKQLNRTLPTLSPATAQSTQQAIAAYQAIVTKGGWPKVSPIAENLKVGAKSAAVPSLRMRLLISGDLDLNSGDPQVFDSYVDAAVRRFQLRHGLHPDGILHDDTLGALNVPADIRLAQLKVNTTRLDSLTADLGKDGNRLVVANIPAAQIEAIEDGIAVQRHIAVAGRPDRPSPLVNSKIIQVNFNPYWTVPVSIVRKDLIPIMQKDPNYLTENHIRIYDSKHNELTASQIDWYSTDAVNYRFRQDPGHFNSLGRMRINFPSPDGVYMHDTPERNLFGDDFRFASSGCMRVQNVRELVYWILDKTPGWSPQQIDAVIQSGARTDANVAKSIPLHWVYITAWATSDGVVHFRDDIYNRDGVGAQANVMKG